MTPYESLVTVHNNNCGYRYPASKAGEAINWPYPLPFPEDSWLIVNDGAAGNIARSVLETKEWRDLMVLADALEDAGCTEEWALLHLREQHKSPGSWCWCCGCWVLNWLLRREQTIVCLMQASVRDASDWLAAEVINPGDWFGKAHILGIAGAGLYAVEADEAGDALDRLASHDRTRGVLAIDERDYGDYGYQGDDGVWVDLHGTLRPEVSCLCDSEIAGDGTCYDSSGLTLLIEERAFYFGPGLPTAGLPAANFDSRQECEYCRKDTRFHVGAVEGRVYCSEACRISQLEDEAIHEDE